MSFAELTPLIRHLLQLVAGVLVSRGLIDETLAETVIGIGMSVATIVWWQIEARRRGP